MKRVIIGLLCCVTLNAVPDKNAIALNNIFHHQAAGQLNSELELGKIAFYFSKEPIVTRLPAVGQAEKQEEILFLPTVTVSEATRAIMQHFNTIENERYSVKVSLVTKPIAGIEIHISYNPAIMGVAYELFDSIKADKGFMIRFYNKELIERIGKQDKKLLYLAHNNNARPGVVLDCGHGGDDDGAIGVQKLKEKDITLAVGRYVAQLLHKKGIDVFLTRSADYTLPLDARTTYANKCTRANLFVSIHANRAARVEANGVETFCLHPSLFRDWQSTLTREQKKVVDTHMSTLCQEGNLLAQCVQNNVLASARTSNSTIFDRTVKKAASQVLLGTNKPAILIEIGFLSNEHEAALLQTKEYQYLVADGICNGIVTYLDMNKKHII